MIEFDEAALICDLAETYRIYDYRSLPLQTVATLSAGLRGDSRIVMAMTGVPASQDTLLLATIGDLLDSIRYMFADDSSQRIYKRLSLVQTLLGEEEEKKSGVKGFNSVEEFKAALAKFETGE